MLVVIFALSVIFRCYFLAWYCLSHITLYLQVALVKTMYVHLHPSCCGKLGQLVMDMNKLMNRPDPVLKVVVTAVRCEGVLDVLAAHTPGSDSSHLKYFTRAFWGTEFDETTPAGRMWRKMVQDVEVIKPKRRPQDMYKILHDRISILL